MPDHSKYFDFNATTPMLEVAKEAWLEAASVSWHNPSSLYREAGAARHQLEDCRERLADWLGIDEPERVVFTSGATEANNALIESWAESSEKPVAVSSIEHPCIRAASKRYLNEESVREIPVDPLSGAVEVEALSSWIQAGSVSAVSVMAANNETGCLQPWREIARLCRAKGVQFHTDAAQWIGKMPSDELAECDYITGSGHKFGAGKGVGFIVLPEGAFGDKFSGLVGGPQEEGKRAGTENLPAIAGMLAALETYEDQELKNTSERGSDIRDRFEAQLHESLSVQIVGKGGSRLWNTSMFILPHSKNVKWLARLSQLGFSISTGSACSAGKGNPSQVMMAMGLSYEEMGRVVRVSGGWESSLSDWMALAEAFQQLDSDLRAQ